MLELKDGKKILTTPVSEEDLKDIHIGDIVYLNGSMTTCRDVAHRRLVEGGRKLPVDVRDAAIFHAGPIIRPLENDKFEMVSVRPTTSMRMEKFEKEFVEKTGVKVIIGKGGMGPNTEYACKNYKAIHCVFPAGNAVVAATEVEEIVRAEWRDLGMPETLWNCSRGCNGGRGDCGGRVERSRNAGNTLELPCQRVWSADRIHRYRRTQPVRGEQGSLQREKRKSDRRDLQARKLH